jgi:hypothetical protein
MIQPSGDDFYLLVKRCLALLILAQSCPRRYPHGLVEAILNLKLSLFRNRTTTEALSSSTKLMATNHAGSFCNGARRRFFLS